MPMGIVLEQMPIEAPSFAHSWRWANSWPMKRSFFPGARSDNRKEDGDSRIAARDRQAFCEAANFCRGRLIVREGKEEIFAEGVEKRERELVVLVFAVDRIGGEIFQRSFIQPMFIEAETRHQISGAVTLGQEWILRNGEDAGNLP